MAFGIYYIPNGPGNLAALFPSIDWTKVKKYQIRIYGTSGGGSGSGGPDPIAYSSINWLNGGCCDIMRIHFVNFLGTIDAINFRIVQKEFGATSDQYTRPAPYPMAISQHGRNRFNVKANSTVTLELNDYPQEENEWINELIAAPRAWIEWLGNIADNQPDYIPIIIDDVKILDVTENDKFANAIRITMTYSYDKMIIRN